MRAAARLFGGQIPNRAIERVAGCAGGKRGLQSAAVEALAETLPQRLNRRDDAFRRFSVAGIGDGFAAAPMDAVAQFDHHYDGFGLAAATDGESRGERPALDCDGEFHIGNKYDRS